jgi:uncharacterized protein YxeA
MRNILLLVLEIMLMAVAAPFAISQTNAEIEERLIAGVKELESYSTYSDNYDPDKLTRAQDAFEQMLLKYTATASTLSYDFNQLAKYVHVATSEDRRLRIYSWDLQDGGTMHRFGRVYQFEGAGGKVYSNAGKVGAESIGYGFVSDIFTLDTRAGTVYIVCSTFIGSTKDYIQSASLYAIAGGVLDPRKLIKTRSGLTNKLEFEYDNFSVIDRTDLPEKLVTFEKETGTLRIPVVVRDEEFPDGRVTNRRISYRFNGTYFVKVS